jgi:hypothetical protein
LRSGISFHRRFSSCLPEAERRMRRLSERRRYVNAYSRCRRRIVFCYRTGYAAPPLRPHLKRALAKKHSLSRPCSRNPPSPDCDGTERPSKSLFFTTPEKAIAEKDSYSRAPLRNAAPTPTGFTEIVGDNRSPGTHNETLSVAAMGVSNPDRSPVGIHG